MPKKAGKDITASELEEDSDSQGSLESYEGYVSEGNNSLYLPSESSTLSVSELAFDMEIILREFVPTECMPTDHNAIVKKLERIDSSSLRTSEGSKDGNILEGDVRDFNADSHSDAMSLDETEDGSAHKDEYSSMEMSDEEQVDKFVKDLRSVTRALNLERFLLFVKDDVLKKKFEMLNQEIDANKTDLKSRRLDVDGRGFKKAAAKEENASAYTQRPLKPRKTKNEAASEKAQEAADTKSVEVYSRECMGGFSSSVKGDGYLYVSSASRVDRPSQVTGNLGREAGDHVIPLALLTRYLERLVQGKEVYEAIAIVRGFAAQLSSVDKDQGTTAYEEQHEYQDIIDGARGFQEPSTPVMSGFTRDEDHKAFEFLKARLIPSVIKRWNNQTRTAFKSIKSQSERGTEGDRVKNVLRIILSSAEGSADLSLIKLTPENLSHLSSVIDYDPVGRQHPRANNGLEQLSLVLGDIIEIHQIMGDSHDSTKIIFDRFLQEHGWIQYFQENPQEIGLARGSRPEKEQIKEIIMGELLKHYPNMSNELEPSTQRKKSELEQQGYQIVDVPGDGNCFFHSIESLFPGSNFRQLRADAIQEISRYPGRYRDFVLDRDINRYIDMMGQNGAWADHIIIQAMADRLHRNIEIIHTNADNNIRIRSINANDGDVPLRVLYTGNHYMPIKRDNSRRHLVRLEKELTSQREKRSLMDLLSIGLSEREMNIIRNLNQSLAYPPIQKPLSSAMKTTKEGSVTLMAESDHKADHKQNILALLNKLDSEKIMQNTVICIERKEEGKNFGMRDVALLADIIEHNQHSKQPVELPRAISESMIYQDALLYYKAKVKGIEVIGLEGKDLKFNQSSPLYDSERESYMARRIEQLSVSGKDVVFMVGSAHVSGLKKKLSIMVKERDSMETTKLPRPVAIEILRNSDMYVSGETVQASYHSSGLRASKAKAK